MAEIIHQMTLDEWMNMKESLKADIKIVQSGFIRIGYKLRRIRDEKLYERDGYTSMGEFAENEYHLSKSTVSRFITINEKYSEGGYSQTIRPELAQYGWTKLTEMLGLPDSDLEMVDAETNRADIRALKQFNKEEPAAEDTSFQEIVEAFFRINPDMTNELFASKAFEESDVRKMAEIVNPSGSRSFRNAGMIMMLHENSLQTKKAGEKPEQWSWEMFFGAAEAVFEGCIDGKKTWANKFEPDSDQEDTEEVQEQDVEIPGEETREVPAEVTEEVPPAAEDAPDKPEEMSTPAEDREEPAKKKKPEVAETEEPEQAEDPDFAPGAKLEKSPENLSAEASFEEEKEAPEEGFMPAPTEPKEPESGPEEAEEAGEAEEDPAYRARVAAVNGFMRSLKSWHDKESYRMMLLEARQLVRALEELTGVR